MMLDTTTLDLYNLLMQCITPQVSLQAIFIAAASPFPEMPKIFTNFHVNKGIGKGQLNVKTEWRLV